MDDHRRTIIDEHFWFTLTTLTVNGFLINSPHVTTFLARFVSTMVSAYAGFLVVHRSAEHSGKLETLGRCCPRLWKRDEKDKWFWDKLLETIFNLGYCAWHVLFVFCEFSGALFYLVLIVLSCIGVYLKC